MKFICRVRFNAFVPESALQEWEDQPYCAAMYFRDIFKANFAPMGWAIADHQKVTATESCVPLYELWHGLRRSMRRVDA